MLVEFFEAPGPNGEIPTWDQIKPRIVDHLLSAADSADLQASSPLPEHLKSKAAGTRDEYVDAAHLVATADSERVFKVLLVPTAGRRGVTAPPESGRAKARAEISRLFNQIAAVLEREPGASVTLMPRLQPRVAFPDG